jgi:hypothetical protein
MQTLGRGGYAYEALEDAEMDWAAVTGATHCQIGRGKINRELSLALDVELAWQWRNLTGAVRKKAYVSSKRS